MWTEKLQWIFPGGVSLSVTDNPEVGFIKTQSRFVIVVSHDCEFNEGKRGFFLVARIENVPKLSDEQLHQLRRTNDISQLEHGVQVPVDTFVLDPLDSCFDKPMRVNFCTITPLPMSYLSDAVKMKRAEMLHTTRVQLRDKLGYFFGRRADDIPEEQKAPPPTPATPPPEA